MFVSIQLSAISYQLSVYALRARYANRLSATRTLREQLMGYAHATRTAKGQGLTADCLLLTNKKNRSRFG
ncbi:hypothetical protein [Moorena sp. SIO3B2]|uniref:hypothetical protein n=1 Tax=Moorena sp. SIO3B2 TaxID=2607827 RepID=UPI0013C85653|nr:hypothetical protein [Moorena sp. SIO3B2]NEP35479.1 hypothetical protein [Moorena sp. SIO3B2]